MLFDFTNEQTLNSINMTLASSVQVQGGVAVARALLLAQQVLFSTSYGSRFGIKPVCVLFSHESPSSSSEGVESAAALLKERGTLLVAIGIPTVTPTQFDFLLDITGLDSFVLSVQKLNELNSSGLADVVLPIFCQPAILPPPKLCMNSQRSLVFLFDLSASIDASSFARMLDFAVSAVNMLSVSVNSVRCVICI